jgi:nucleotide-binding universal stress UspA family protein
VVKTFVVPLDGSATTERAAHVAAVLARSWGAELVLTAVTTLRDPASMELGRIARELEAGNVRCEVVEADDVCASLQRVVAEVPEPVICMTTHARGRAGGALLGSTAEGLLREIPLSFVLVGPQCPPTWTIEPRRLLACLDGSSTSAAIIEPSSQWCKALGLDLLLAEVFNPNEVERSLAYPRFADRVAERLRPELPSVKTAARWSRHPADEIVHLGETLPASLIAMGTHGRSGLERVALGSVTMAVVHRSKSPVLVIKPAKTA